jgi:simple sugar transport system ATP-binding protein
MQLELRGISKTFGPLKANDDISYTFNEGITYAILGENGAGKSTLMKIIAGYQPPDPGGDILLDGVAVRSEAPIDAIKHGIGMLYQDPLDFAPMTVLENYMTARPDGSFLPDWSTARRDLYQIAERFGFKFDPNSLIETLTVGERQQLEIVRLLSLGVKIMILDEPTTGISEEQRQQLFATLRQLADEDRLTIMIVTHKLEDVEALCDEVMVLRHGKVTGTCSMPTPASELVTMMFGHPEQPEARPSAELGEVLMDVRDLTVSTRLMTIDNISVEVRQGEVLGLAGLDGSGQVAFMRACAGLDRISWQDHAMSVIALVAMLVVFVIVLGYSGTVLIVAALILLAVTLGPFGAALMRYSIDRTEHIYFRGKPTQWSNYRDLRKLGLSYLSAGRLEEGLIAGLTLTQHAALTNQTKKPWINWQKTRKRTTQTIQIFDVRGQEFSPIQTLSGGNQQRVALALLPDNLRLAFLENPTRGLDVHSARNIWNLLLARREDGAAIVFSSPDLDEIVEYSDRVMVFSSGRWTMVDDPSRINAQELGLLIGGKSAS